MQSELSDDEDFARPQFPELSATLPQAKLPPKLDEEGVVNNVPHVANDDDEDSARPQLPPVALPQAESPHKLDEEGAVDDVPHIADNTLLGLSSLLSLYPKLNYPMSWMKKVWSMTYSKLR